MKISKTQQKKMAQYRKLRDRPIDLKKLPDPHKWAQNVLGLLSKAMQSQ